MKLANLFFEDDERFEEEAIKSIEAGTFFEDMCDEEHGADAFNDFLWTSNAVGIEIIDCDLDRGVKEENLIIEIKNRFFMFSGVMELSSYNYYDEWMSEVVITEVYKKPRQITVYDYFDLGGTQLAKGENVIS